jgi:hypothetical protein
VKKIEGMEARTPQVRRWDVSATKDILAAITFLLTGLLFLIAQAGKSAEPRSTEDAQGDGAEAVMVTDGIQKVPDEPGERPPVTWDS